LSYAIQNFYRLSPVNRLTYRRYYNWLYRNTASIWYLINYLHLNSNIYLQTLSKSLISPKFLKSLFSKSLIKLFTKKILKWRPVKESQWVRGVEYWAYKTILHNTLINEAAVKPVLYHSEVYFYNQYLFEKRYVLISFYQKYYRTVLVNFLHLLLRPWQFWRSHLFYDMNSLLITGEFFLLRFLNTRLFKVYSV